MQPRDTGAAGAATISREDKVSLHFILISKLHSYPFACV